MSTAAAPPLTPAPSLALPAAPGVPYYMSQTTFRKFTLDEYHKMIETGVLVSGEPYELLEGHLVHKMSRGTPHDAAVLVLNKRFLRLAPTGWEVCGQSAVTLTTGSEPEPDFAVVRGDENTYRNRHPGPADIGLAVEVSDSSLRIDRHDKGRIYAQNSIPVYWVVNVVDKVIEVYTRPGGTGDAAAYTQRDDYPVGTAVPVVLDGTAVGTVAVADVMG